MTAKKQTHTIYLLRANTIPQSPKTSGSQKILNFPQIPQEQWLTSLRLPNKNEYMKGYTKRQKYIQVS